ncbi:MAG: bifunctional riboflavin kinase/FAD synthetase [bacterium]
MRLFTSVDGIDLAPDRGRVVAIGVFDGVHRGHQRILAEAVESAKEIGALSTAVTFYPHPELVLRPKRKLRMLTSLERKAELIEALGVDELVVVKFDRAFAQLSAEAFCRLVLSHRLGARRVLVGENFRFGHRGIGTYADLRVYGTAHDFEVLSVALAEEGGEAISSTRIRKSISAGRVADAARLLGRPHRIEGEVVHGAGRGRALKAPTANLSVDAAMAIPRLGVYVTRSSVDGGPEGSSVTSVGTNPTFEADKKVRIETLLLDRVGDFYGARLAVDFLERIRAQRVFPDGASLAARIKRDVEIARGYADSRAATAAAGD